MTADLTSITTLAQKLVQMPSQGGIDSPVAVVEAAFAFAQSLGLPAVKVLDDAGNPVAVVAEIKGAHAGKTWAVNATLDTAPAGNAAQWNGNPFSGEVKDGVLHGRGAGDSKLAASMFMHLAQDMLSQKENMHGNFLLILDADEHTGNFGGIRQSLKNGYKPDGIMIGYAGDDKIVVGGRGFSRYEIVVSGKAAHSGATAEAEDNALLRVAELVRDLNANKPAAPQDPEFDKQPKLTVTQIEGGDGFSVVPSKAIVRIDMRLTPTFNEAAADSHIRAIVAAHDAQNNVPDSRATEIRKISSEPPFLTKAQSELRRALADSVAEITGKPVAEYVAGPSNIGNFLGKQGIEVTAGYGVPATGVHGANERADLLPLAKVYSVYHSAFKKLLKL